MKNILILGCGHIGQAIANILNNDPNYCTIVADNNAIFPPEWPQDHTITLDINELDDAIIRCQKKKSPH